jgi:hypothetical protein
VCVCECERTVGAHAFFLRDLPVCVSALIVPFTHISTDA